jgi:hypothetical protein
VCCWRVIIEYLHEPEEGGETLDLEALCESVVLGGIDLGDVQRGVLGFENSGGGGVFRGELLAVAAKNKQS